MKSLFYREKYLGYDLEIREKLVIYFIFVFVIALFYFNLSNEQKAAGAFYYGVIILSVSLAMAAQPSMNRPVKRFPLWLSFLVLYFVLGFRDISGIDDQAYQIIFENVNTFGVWATFFTSFMEPGYLGLCALVGNFTENYYVCQALTSFIPLFLFYKGFIKYQTVIYIPLAVLLLCGSLYFQMLSTSLVRMFIAISIVFCYSLHSLFQSRTRSYVVSIFLAATIHYSALIMLLFTPLSLSKDLIVKHWKKIALFLILVTPVLFLIVSKVAGTVGGRYEGYGEGSEKSFGLDLFDTLPFLLFALYYKKMILAEKQGIYVGAIVLLIFSIVCSVMSMLVPLGRVIFYMNLSLYFILSGAFRVSRKNKILIASMVILYLFLYLSVSQFMLESHAEHLFPYRNIFFTI